MNPLVLDSLRPEIRPRSDWASGRPAKGAIPAEDVRLLIIHHTSLPANGYGAEDVGRLLRGIYDFHTGPQKRWPDIAYNFMVDKFGRIFEARSGSIDSSPEGSATGGNQGFSQLCCFLGDHAEEPPTPEAQSSMVSLLAWLAYRHELDLSLDATVTFESKGSNRHPAGTSVTSSTLALHREMSQTSCPGDACVAIVRSDFHGRVMGRISAAEDALVASEPQPVQSSTSSVATTAPTATTARVRSTFVSSTSGSADDLVAFPTSESASPNWLVHGMGGVAGATVALLGSSLWLRRRRLGDFDPGMLIAAAPNHEVISGSPVDSYRHQDLTVDVFVPSGRREFAASTVPASISSAVRFHIDQHRDGQAGSVWRALSAEVDRCFSAGSPVSCMVVATDRSQSYIVRSTRVSVSAIRPVRTVELTSAARIDRTEPTVLDVFASDRAPVHVAVIRIHES